MAFAELLRIFQRRWYFSLLAAVLLFVGAAGGFLLGHPTYQAKTEVLLLPSPISSSADGKTLSNPYLALGNGLTLTGQVLSLSVADDAVARRLAAQGATARYTLALDADVAAPVVEITATDRDPAVAQQTMVAVLKELQDELVSAQKLANAPSDTYITLSDLTSTPKPQTQWTDPIRLAIGGAVVGLLLGLFPILLVERQARAKSRRAAAAAGTARARARGAAARPNENAVFDAALAGQPPAHSDNGVTSTPDVSPRREPTIDVPTREAVPAQAGSDDSGGGRRRRRTRRREDAQREEAQREEAQREEAQHDVAAPAEVVADATPIADEASDGPAAANPAEADGEPGSPDRPEHIQVDEPARVV